MYSGSSGLLGSWRMRFPGDFAVDFIGGVFGFLPAAWDGKLVRYLAIRTDKAVSGGSGGGGNFVDVSSLAEFGHFAEEIGEGSADAGLVFEIFVSQDFAGGVEVFNQWVFGIEDCLSPL